MNKGICLLSAIPVRHAPDDKSEMITQLIWGEMFLVIEKTEKWLYVKTVFDKYEGWVLEKQVTYIEYEEFDRLCNVQVFRTGSINGFITEQNTGKSYMVTAGADLYNISSEGSFEIAGQYYHYQGVIIDKISAKNPAEYAKLFLNCPYLWGGRTVMGVDCSGLVQIACKMSGKVIARDTNDQSQWGEVIHFHHEALAGDLVFFDDDEGIIRHVGMIVEPGLIIHADGKVRIDSFDQQGIYNAEKKQYTHKLRLIKRLV